MISMEKLFSNHLFHYNVNNRIKIEKDFNYGRYINLICYVIGSIVSLPLPFWYAKAGVDESWLIGLHWALKKGLLFGKQIVFTYGPLGFLGRPTLIDYDLWKISLAFMIFCHILFFLSMYVFMENVTSNLNRFKSVYNLFVIISLIIIPLGLGHKIVLTILLLSFMAISINSKVRTLIIYFILAFIVSIASLLKFNLAVISLSLLIMSLCFFLIFKRNIKSVIIVIYVISFFLLSTFVLMVVYSQDPNLLLDYVNSSLYIVIGYVTMGLPGSIWRLWFAIIIIIGIFTVMIYAFIIKDRKMFPFTIMSLMVSVTYFKHGFVRQDIGHEYIYYLIMYVILIMVIPIIFNKRNSRNKLDNKILLGMKCYLLIILVVSGIVLFPKIIAVYKPGAELNLLEKKSSYEKAILFLNNKTFFDDVIIKSKENIIREYKASPEMFDAIRNDSVDIIPWDIALVWAKDLNWSPRPIFQSYNAYTKELDSMNAKHFEENNPPKFIIFSYKTLDRRYPIFDEPNTFRNVLCNYEHIDSYNEFIILQYDQTASNCTRYEEIKSLNAKIGEPINIPNFKNGYLFAHIDLDYSYYGKLKNTIYKSSPAYIKFELTDGNYSKKYRFIPDTAANGIFVSKYVRNIRDVEALFNSQLENNIRSVKITVENPTDYDIGMRVEFFGMYTNSTN